MKEFGSYEFGEENPDDGSKFKMVSSTLAVSKLQPVLFNSKYRFKYTNLEGEKLLIKSLDEAEEAYKMHVAEEFAAGFSEITNKPIKVAIYKNSDWIWLLNVPKEDFKLAFRFAPKDGQYKLGVDDKVKNWGSIMSALSSSSNLSPRQHGRHFAEIMLRSTSPDKHDKIMFSKDVLEMAKDLKLKHKITSSQMDSWMRIQEWIYSSKLIDSSSPHYDKIEADRYNNMTYKQRMKLIDEITIRLLKSFGAM